MNFVGGARGSSAPVMDRGYRTQNPVRFELLGQPLRVLGRAAAAERSAVQITPGDCGRGVLLEPSNRGADIRRHAGPMPR